MLSVDRADRGINRSFRIKNSRRRQWTAKLGVLELQDWLSVSTSSSILRPTFEVTPIYFECIPRALRLRFFKKISDQMLALATMNIMEPTIFSHVAFRSS